MQKCKSFTMRTPLMIVQDDDSPGVVERRLIAQGSHPRPILPVAATEMRVVALVSGGKDSCYNMLQCVAAGHDIVALANLQPENKDELDSYMYQTVGHQGVEMYAEAMDLPLFRQSTHGVALQQDQVYTPTPEDEVEDLYELLRTVKEEVDIDAVAVGAILSDYQRIRVENVCNRLGLVPLAYLWRRNQEELLQEMIDCEISAIVIKVAALGLSPSKHLGITLGDLQPHILKMKEKYGLNVCGEGGEFETFTLDCPLFNKTIIIDEWETVIHSNDAIAPVGYLNFKNFHLVQKDSIDPELSLRERLLGLPVKTWRELISDLDEDVTEKKVVGRGEGDEDSVDEGSSMAEDRPLEDAEGADAAAAVAADTDMPTPDPTSANVSPSNPEAPSLKSAATALDPLQVVWEPCPLPDGPTAAKNNAGWTWFGGIVGQGEDSVLAIREALHKLAKLVEDQTLEMTDLISVSLYVRNMAHYTEMNAEYIKVFNHINPPARVCVEVPLPAETPVLLEGLAFRSPTTGYINNDITKHTMHVQSVSHWAPANIGPYSQAVRIGDIIYVAGQIPLVPGTMQIVSGGARKQCRLALRHVGRIVRAIDSNTQLRDVVQGICYVTHPSYIPEARREWEKRTNNAIVDYVVVPQLPRSALLEWHIWAHRHNNRFEYEETGCCIGDFRVSIRRRWNYENNVSAVVCYVSHSGTGSLTASMDHADIAARLSHESTPAPTPPQICGSVDDMSDEHLSEVICYTLAKLLRKTDAATVCHLRLFCKTGWAPTPDRIHAVLARAEGFNIVHSIVPVCQLHNAHTFLSICGVRHN